MKTLLTLLLFCSCSQTWAATGIIFSNITRTNALTGTNLFITSTPVPSGTRTIYFSDLVSEIFRVSTPIATPTPVAATNFITDFTVQVNKVTLTNDAFFQYSTNYTVGLLRQSLWILDPNGTNRAIGFNASWKFNNTPPAYTGTNLFFVLSLTAFGVGETNVLASYQTFTR